MARKEKEWLPIKDFLALINKPMKHVYYRIERRDWRDGYVVKKGRHGRYEFGCIEEYEKWNNLI
jgi:hypothetical protein